MPQEHSNKRPSDQRWLEDGLHVGEWFVEPQRNRITRNGSAGEQHVRLEPKVMQVLVCMTRRPDRTVTKDTFMDEVWSDTVVSNDALLRCISELRSALGDDARAPEYVETVRKVGYRLIAPVSYLEDEAPPSAEPPPPPERSEHPEVLNTRTGSAAPDVLKQELKQGPPPTAGSPLPHTKQATSVRPRPAHVPSEPHATHDGARTPGAGSRIAGWLMHAGGARRWAAVAAVLLLVAGAVALRGWWGASDPAPSEAVPFTSFPGEEFDSALSPNGERVAFVWNGGEASGGSTSGGDTTPPAEERRFDIYVKQRGAENPLRITDTPEREHSPAWSPDGNHLAFLRARDGGAEVIIAPVIGGGERTVARFSKRQVKELVWAPEGETLALSVQRQPYGAFRIVLLTMSGRQKRVLTTPPDHYRGDVDLAFSPDGKTIAFARAVVDRVQDLYTVPVSGGTPERLTHDRAAVSGLDWTTDGESIIFASNRKGASRLWRLPATGGAPTWVATSTGGGLHQPSIARTGTRMTLTERSLDVNIWRLHSVTGYDRLTSHRLLSSTRWDSYPDVAPDGQRLAFVSKRSGSFEIWTSRRDGSDPAQLTSFEGPFVSAPRWAPSGEQIAFAVQGEDGADVYAITPNGGGLRQLTKTPESDVAPRFSRDGRWIYFASNRSGRWQVWRKSMAGGPARQVTQNGGFAAQEGPEGTYLYYVKKDEPGLWRRPLRLPRIDTLRTDTLLSTPPGSTSSGSDAPRKPPLRDGAPDEPSLLSTLLGSHFLLEGAEEERVTAALEPFDWGNWAITEQGFYFVSRDGSTPALMYQSFGSRVPVRMAYLRDLPRHPSLAVAPGARWFLHAKVERNESDILVVERFR